MKPIPFFTARLPDPSLVARDYAEIFESGVFTNSGPFERRFAAALAERIGQGVAVSPTSNATAGLQLAAQALFRHDRKQVLVASFTFAAVPSAVRWCGYEPLFMDVDATSWHPDPVAAEHVLERDGDRIAGILLTNTFGTANDVIDRWESLARCFELALVIDSAPGFGSRYPWGEPLGARGDCEIFSFHATKTVAIGEGGAIASRDHELIERIDRMKNYGFDDARTSQEIGTNAKLPEIASAIGLRQLDVLTDRLARRRGVLAGYVNGLGPLGFEFQPGMEASAPPFLSAMVPEACQRDVLGRALTDAEIAWRAYYNPPVHRQQSFAGLPTVGTLTVTEDISRRIISLPVDDELSSEDLARIVGVVRRVVGG